MECGERCRHCYSHRRCDFSCRDLLERGILLSPSLTNTHTLTFLFVQAVNCFLQVEVNYKDSINAVVRTEQPVVFALPRVSDLRVVCRYSHTLSLFYFPHNFMIILFFFFLLFLMV